MALFSTKKSKAKKAEKAAKAEQKKVEEAKPAQAPYKHTPSHAAADSQSHGAGDREVDREQIAQESQRRLERAHTDSTLGNASGPRAMAQSAMYGRPTPSKSMRSSGSANTYARNNSGYFTPASQQAPSFDSPILGNPKMQAAARDRGYINPHHSADSGYSSVGPTSAANSRAPSTHRQINDQQPPPMLRQPTNFLPELTLGQELAREPAFSENSYTEEESGQIARFGQSNNAGREYEEAQMERAESTDKESVKSSRSSRSRKQTRFEEAIEPVPQITQQQHDRFQRRTQPAAGETRDWQEQPTHQHTSDYSTQAGAMAQADHEQDMARQNAVVSPIAEQKYEMMSPYGQNEQATSYERGREPEQYHTQPLNAATASYQYQANTRQASQNRQRSGSIPPLSILDGLKVNKRGRILDEEGDPIGELFDGDIMDCVRQKANANGEVLDEYGGVVGRVRTLARDSHSVQRSSMSSRPGENDYFQRHFQLPSQIGNGQQSRRQSLQQPVSSQHQNSLRSIPDQPPPQETISSMPIAPLAPRRPSVAPLDMEKGEGALELDASHPVEQEPVFDISEPFMPPPHVPAKSPRRSESPSPVREYQNAGAELPTTEHTPPGSERSLFKTSAQSSETAVPRPIAPMGHRTFEAEQPSVSTQAEQQSAIPEEDEDPTPRATPMQQPRSILQQPSAPVTKPVQQAPAASARLLARSTSEKQHSFTRPPMPPVPQDPPTGKSPTLFSYKGDIPTTDGPPPGLGAGAARVKSPPLPSFPRQAFAAGAAGGSPFAGTGVPGAPPMPSRRISSNGVPMSGAAGMAMQRPGMKSRYSTNTPLVRSPLSSHETTPPESDEGSAEGSERDQVGAMSYSKFRAHSRAPSVRTVSSVTSQGKPRTYFTHAGRVTVDAGELPPSAVAAQTAVKNAANAPAEKKEEKETTKKKNRMSIFGKKK